jgi:hypothetical protein
VISLTSHLYFPADVLVKLVELVYRHTDRHLFAAACGWLGRDDRTSWLAI